MTIKLKRIFAAVISVVMVATLFAACTGKENKERVLKLGLDSSFPPMGFTDENGKIVGFDIDVANAAVEFMDDYDKIECVPIKWDIKDGELASGNIDMIWNGFTVQGREDDYTWSEAYMDNSQMIVVKEGSGIKTLADLAGKIVIAQEDSSGLRAIQANEAVMNSIAKLNEIDNYENAILELESGSADAMVIDQAVIEYKIAQGKTGLVILDETVGTEQYAVGFKKGNTELRDKVQAALDKLAENGKLAEISTKWFGSDITTIGK